MSWRDQQALWIKETQDISQWAHDHHVAPLTSRGWIIVKPNYNGAFMDVMEWLHANMGPRLSSEFETDRRYPRNQRIWEYPVTGYLAFRTRADAMLFKLRFPG